MDKQIFLQAFMIYLQQQSDVVYREVKNGIFASKTQHNRIAEIAANENGYFESMVADLAACAFLQREHGEWVDANDLKQRFQQLDNLL